MGNSVDLCLNQPIGKTGAESMRRGSKCVRSVLIPAVLATTLSVGAVGPTYAATSTRPDFKLPLACGTKWLGKTYAGHRAAVDFTSVSGASEHQPVLAAAAGRVYDVKSTTWGTVVGIDHGGGWKTRYAHLSGVRVSMDQYVSEGRAIGRIGAGYPKDRSHWTGPHLHFEELRDGTSYPMVVDGAPANVTASSPKTFLSTNCLAGTTGFWFADQMIRAPDGTVDYVTVTGERYWVPNSSTQSCLQGRGAKLRSVTAAEFSSIPRNEYGDPAGRWADCNSWSLGWMVKGSTEAVWFIAPNGFRYHVPNESTVMCLGGWAAVRSITDAGLGAIPKNPWARNATCQAPLFGQLVKGSADAVYFVGPRGTRYYVASSSIVNCLGGRARVVRIRDARLNALPTDSHGIRANCNSALFDRLIRKANGQVDYVNGAHLRYWVPNGDVQACLGGTASRIYLSEGRFDAISRNPANTWATCSTKNG